MGTLRSHEATKNFDEFVKEYPGLLEATPMYQELLAEGMSPEAIRLHMKDTMADVAGFMGGAANAIFGTVGERALLGLVGKQFGSTFIRRFFTVLAGETAGEYVTGLTEEAGRIMGEEQIGIDTQPEIDKWVRLKRNAQEEAIASVGMGSAGGVVHGLRGRETQTKTKTEAGTGTGTNQITRSADGLVVTKPDGMTFTHDPATGIIKIGRAHV